MANASAFLRLAKLGSMWIGNWGRLRSWAW